MGTWPHRKASSATSPACEAVAGNAEAMLGASMKVASHKRSLWILLIVLGCIHLHGIDRDQKLADLYHTAWTFKDGAPAEIHALAQTTDGFLWLGAATGLFRFDGIRFQA